MRSAAEPVLGRTTFRYTLPELGSICKGLTLPDDNGPLLLQTGSDLGGDLKQFLERIGALTCTGPR